MIYFSQQFAEIPAEDMQVIVAPGASKGAMCRATDEAGKPDFSSACARGSGRGAASAEQAKSEQHKETIF